MDVLCDSGAGTSVMSCELFPDVWENTGSKVHGIGGSQLVGKPVECNISLSSSWSTSHQLKPMNIADNEALVILGRDFLSKYETTMFDWKHNKVRIGNDWIFMVSDNTENDVHQLIDQCKIGSEGVSRKQATEIRNLLEEFCQVFVKNSKAPKLCSTEVHRILSFDNSRICKDKVRRLPMKWRGTISKQISEMLQNGIITPSCSPYNSNPLLVDKKDKTKRFVVDFRKLNETTIPDAYPLPNVNELIDSCREAKYFTQMDLASGYWCLEVHEEDRHKTAFSVPNGKYEFKRMPFGLKNSQATFQRMIDRVIRELHDMGYTDVFGYVDNILIFSETLEDHIATLRAVLEALARHNLSVRRDKCEFAQQEIDLLGFNVGHNQVKPCQDNVQKLLDFPTTRTKK